MSGRHTEMDGTIEGLDVHGIQCCFLGVGHEEPEIDILNASQHQVSADIQSHLQEDHPVCRLPLVHLLVPLYLDEYQLLHLLAILIVLILMHQVERKVGRRSLCTAEDCY